MYSVLFVITLIAAIVLAVFYISNPVRFRANWKMFVAGVATVYSAVVGYIDHFVANIL